MKQIAIITILILSIFIPSEIFSQETLSWKTLSDVSFRNEVDEATQTTKIIPNFGEQVKNYENKTVIIKGYFIPIDADNNFYVLSKFPYSSCFFCGGAGPETVVELEMDFVILYQMKMTEPIRFQGEFALNATDYDHCNYILKNAKLIDK